MTIGHRSSQDIPLQIQKSQCVTAFGGRKNQAGCMQAGRQILDETKADRDRRVRASSRVMVLLMQGT